MRRIATSCVPTVSVSDRASARAASDGSRKSPSASRKRRRSCGVCAARGRAEERVEVLGASPCARRASTTRSARLGSIERAIGEVALEALARLGEHLAVLRHVADEARGARRGAAACRRRSRRASRRSRARANAGTETRRRCARAARRSPPDRRCVAERGRRTKESGPRIAASTSGSRSSPNASDEVEEASRARSGRRERRPTCARRGPCARRRSSSFARGGERRQLGGLVQRPVEAALVRIAVDEARRVAFERRPARAASAGAGARAACPRPVAAEPADPRDRPAASAPCRRRGPSWRGSGGSAPA